MLQNIVAGCCLWLLMGEPGMGPARLADVVVAEFETYFVVDGRETLAGRIMQRPGTGSRTFWTPTASGRLLIRLSPLSPGATAWEEAIPMTAAQLEPGLPIRIRVGRLRGGYYQLHGKLVGVGGISPIEEELADSRGVPVVLSVGEVRPGKPATKNGNKEDYLAFVRATVDCLIGQQSATLGGKPDGVRFITVTRPIRRSYRSIGYKRPDGKYQSYWFPESPIEYQPVVADLDAWLVLDWLSKLTGEPRYRDMTAAMAGAFARCGFDAQSGLGYLGESAALDVVRARGVSCRPGGANPSFKPKNTGTYPELPLDRLWARAPDQMHRMCRAMFLGLVTDPASMDFNRYCSYAFRDTEGRHAMERTPSHCGFETAGARMVHWWASCFGKTGDADCLAWAQRMADKWRAIQDPHSGLVPNFFGGLAPAPGCPMPPGKWVEPRGAALAAVAWLAAAAELRTRPEGHRLAAQLTEMGVRLALGVARHAYDPSRRVFREHLDLNGRPYLTTARYCFRTQAEKDAAVKVDPAMAQVKVYDGAGFYRPCSYWEFCAGSTIPLDLARAMHLSQNRELALVLARWVPDLIDEACRQPSAMTEEGAWTFRASGQYIRMLVLLYRQTKDVDFLDLACQLADRELRCLGAIEYPQWWRMPERTALLDGLLALYETLDDKAKTE